MKLQTDLGYAAALVVPLGVYVICAAILGDWIIDDAGISYAYARNVAFGYGFVSQPGRVPVEGFSNFLWVLVLVPLFRLGLFHPVLTPKLLGTLFVLWAFAILRRTLYRQSRSVWPALVAGVMIGAAPPVVIWTTSGLENSLTILLAVALYAQLVEAAPRWEVRGGALAALLAMTHPEGVLYAATGGIVWLADTISGPGSWGDALRRLARYVGAFAALFVPFMAFRMSVFGLPVPHTYYAKRNYPDAWGQVHDLVSNPAGLLGKLVEVGRGIAGPLGVAALLLTLAVVLFLVARRRLPRPLGVAVTWQFVALGTYLLMQADWMGEYRFATLATVFSLLAFVLSGFSLVAAAPGKWAHRSVAAAYFAATVLVGYTNYLPRLLQFAARPTTPFNDIARRYAFKFDAYADLLGLRNGSMFIADAGAPLYFSRLTIFDNAGLFEPAVIHTLKKDTIYWLDAHPEFYDYVFEGIRPTFITTNGFFTRITAFEHDPRFARDYVPITAFDDEYVRQVYGWQLHSGDYVRRDALGDLADVDRLRREYRAPAPPGASLETLRDRMFGWLGWVNPRSPDELMKSALSALYRNGRPNEAATLLEQVLEKVPSHYGATYQLAVALDAAGRTNEGRSMWARMLAMAEASGDEPTAKTARARLQ